MKEHIIEFTKPGTKISKKLGHLIVQQKEASSQIPLDDIQSVIILGSDILISTGAITALLERSVPIVFSDDSYIPLGMLVNDRSHRMVRQRGLAQNSLSSIQNKRLWQKIVVQKIKNQAVILEHLGLEGSLLRKFSLEVDAGDEGNLEAQAARVYWKNVFGDEFVRDKQGVGVNSFLNYGYAILRNTVARAVVATGLCPHYGVFHNNMENPFCLVDDLMEPFRPAVDYLVHKHQEDIELSPDLKRKLVGVLSTEIVYRGQKKPLSRAVTDYVYSFCEAVLAADYKVFVSEFEFSFVEDKI